MKYLLVIFLIVSGCANTECAYNAFHYGYLFSKLNNESEIVANIKGQYLAIRANSYCKE